MSMRPDLGISWLANLEEVKALGKVLGAEIKPIASGRPENSPWTIIGEKTIVDFHLLPQGDPWVNVTCLTRHLHASMGLVSPEISVEPSIENPQSVTLRGKAGQQIIIPKGEEVTFNRI